MSYRIIGVIKLLGFTTVGLMVLLNFGCSSNSLPKPRGYFRIEFPEKQYRPLDSIFPYRFYYPTYGRITEDKDVGAEKYWINIDFPKYKAKIHISYKQINKNLDQMIEDVRTLAYKHTIKADAINERVFTHPEKRVFGVLYDIRGNAASSYQFYVTDSVRHFLRGALYFNVQPNKDSLAPSVEYFCKDMEYLIETVEWK